MTENKLIIDDSIDILIGEKLLADNAEREKSHNKSGKLSAGRLGDPVQWQILYALGIPQKEIDQYVVRKFLRGTQIEEWLVGYLSPVAKQEFVEYRNVVGYIDALCDTKNWESDYGVIPVEVKSVTNMAFTHIKKEGVKPAHRLQAGLYALAKGVPHFAVSYVASDDLRVLTFIEETKKVEGEINQIINEYEDARAKGIIPAFEAKEKWQGSMQYSKYPEWMGLTEEEATKKYLELKK